MSTISLLRRDTDEFNRSNPSTVQHDTLGSNGTYDVMIIIMTSYCGLFLMFY